MLFIQRNRPYILKSTISPGYIYRTNVPYHKPCHMIFHHTESSFHATDINIYRTNVPYHIPCHILYPSRRAILPYHRHTISHTVPHHTQCHIVPYHIPYQAISCYPYHAQLKTPTLTSRQKSTLRPVTMETRRSKVFLGNYSKKKPAERCSYRRYVEHGKMFVILGLFVHATVRGGTCAFTLKIVNVLIKTSSPDDRPSIST